MYLKFKETTIKDFSQENINSLYNEGYLFTRKGKGVMDQTRSLRIDLNKFKLSSENRRILKKTEDIQLDIHSLPCRDYHWSIGKMGKDFYDTKFGKGTFSANKLKELMTDVEKSNFNLIFFFLLNQSPLGFCIALETKEIIHYSYPFYNLKKTSLNMGMGMMLKVILHAQKNKKKYIYLGSVQRPADKYKLQFSGLEWFDGKEWQEDLNELKNLL